MTRFRWAGPMLAAIVLALAPLFLSSFRLTLLGKFLALALVALGLDLLWGYTGVLSLGHGVFFGLGAYSMAMFLKLEAAAGSLPDFMAWSGLHELPWFWRPFGRPLFALAMVPLLPALVAVLVGYPAFRSRIRGPYFAILSQALALITTILIVGQQAYTGGTNGITNFATLFGYPLADPAVQRTLYYVTAGVLAVSFVVAHWLTRTRFGLLMVAVRDGENRARFLGHDPVWIKVTVFALSAALAGIGGALFVPQVGIISPAMMGIVPSVEMAVWVAAGGRGTLGGPVVGAVALNLAKSYLSEQFPSAWQYGLGALVLGIVLGFPDGAAGLIRGVSRRLGRPVHGPRTASDNRGHPMPPSVGRPTGLREAPISGRPEG